MSEYMDMLSRESWKDLGIIKVEENESEIDEKDNPEDLSLRTRSISVQTEDCMQAIISSYFPHLSLDQIQAFLELLATLLVKKNKNQSFSKKVSDCYNNITETNEKPRSPGWTILEPDFAITLVKDDLDEDTEAYKEQKETSKTLDIEPALPSVNENFDLSPQSVKIDRNCSVQSETADIVKMEEAYGELSSSTLPKISRILQGDLPIQAPTTNLRRVTALVPYRIKKVSGMIDTAKKPPQSRDERIVKSLNIPFSVDFIINSSTEEFNELNINLNEEQINLCRDIRRRGKNKIAAQNCRKRKYEQINCLEEELEHFHHRKETLKKENIELKEIHKAWAERIANLDNYIL